MNVVKPAGPNLSDYTIALYSGMFFLFSVFVL